MKKNLFFQEKHIYWERKKMKKKEDEASLCNAHKTMHLFLHEFDGDCMWIAFYNRFGRRSKKKRWLNWCTKWWGVSSAFCKSSFLLHFPVKRATKSSPRTLLQATIVELFILMIITIKIDNKNNFIGFGQYFLFYPIVLPLYKRKRKNNRKKYERWKTFKLLKNEQKLSNKKIYFIQ